MTENEAKIEHEAELDIAFDGLNASVIHNCKDRMNVRTFVWLVLFAFSTFFISIKFVLTMFLMVMVVNFLYYYRELHYLKSRTRKNLRESIKEHTKKTLKFWIINSWRKGK